MQIFCCCCLCALITTSPYLRHDISNLTEVGELTWEQKEQVLRELFARMNSKSQKKKQPMIKEDSNNNLNDERNDEEEEDVDYNDLKTMKINK